MFVAALKYKALKVSLFNADFHPTVRVCYTLEPASLAIYSCDEMFSFRVVIDSAANSTISRSGYFVVYPSMSVNLLMPMILSALRPTAAVPNII